MIHQPENAVTLTNVRCLTQRTHGVMTISLLRQNDVATSFWRNNDIIITSGVCWDEAPCNGETHHSLKRRLYTHQWSISYKVIKMSCVAKSIAFKHHHVADNTETLSSKKYLYYIFHVIIQALKTHSLAWLDIFLGRFAVVIFKTPI